MTATPSSVCGDPFSVFCYESLYQFTLTSDQEVTLQPSSNLVGVQLYLLASCDTDDCVAGASGQGTASVSACLPAGTYYVLAGAPSCFFQTGTIEMVQCSLCSPAATGRSNWSTLKADFVSLR